MREFAGAAQGLDAPGAPARHEVGMAGPEPGAAGQREQAGRQRAGDATNQPRAPTAAVAWISTRYSESISLAPTVARAGVWPAGTHSSHTAFIAA